ncbi:hypothetical protein SELMODRAFT_431737 [Selaginella moellendorffii]|uniref:AP-5 complex subunit zeta-1 C-terminal TPR domain-containing protein n=1 Tax=Selaginella moellendorffii TaxID=88036 RepID=D8TDM1_SELML|nr:hypothetical protein SELMODRAFT_431737 [Selaginella moellendorffii]
MVEMKTHGKKTVEGELITAVHTMSLYSKMPSKRPLTSHGTCGIVNRPSDHNSVLSKGCQALKTSTQIDLKSILPFSQSTCIIHLQLLPESLDGIAYIDMFFMPNNGMALLSLSSLMLQTKGKHCHRQAYMTIGFKKMMARFMSFAVVSFATVLGSSVSASFGQSLEQCTGSLHGNTGNIRNNPALEVHLAGTSLVVSWNEGYVGSSNGVHALKFIPQLLQVYFNITLQDMSDSLLCTLLPMVFFRINAMFPDKAFSIEVQQTCCQFVHTFFKKSPQFIALLKKLITSQPQTSDSKDGVRELFETLELVLYKNLFLWHKTSAILAQSQLLFFVITAIAKLATCHQELLPRARVLRWHNHINYSKRLSGEELKITIAAYD